MGCVMCGCVGLVMCGCFDNCVDVLVICVLVFTASLYFFGLCVFILICYLCEDCCHQVKTQLH